MRPRFLAILVIALIAYVLGTRAGRERYEQMKNAVTSFWNDPSMQRAMDEAKRNAAKSRKAAYTKRG
ncbi:hypothetical protein [Diaminobutyricibacter sp. McL0608]|uniref:hypothetical protein n=1 Tax=Leifsonia sp. McL0608 TaxID=3143537 RepID=UPI0031F2E84D